MSMTGGCLCGQVRYEIKAEPVMTAVCHCKNCQRQAGTLASVIIGLPEDAVDHQGEVKTFADMGESGKAVDRQFCPNCGSPLFSIAESAPGLIFVKAGTLDDTSNLEPTMHIFTKSKQSWVETGDVPCFETFPG